MLAAAVDLSLHSQTPVFWRGHCFHVIPDLIAGLVEGAGSWAHSVGD